jgi:peptidoglycan/LPS O-acetylase OafA/YrhL
MPDPSPHTPALNRLDWLDALRGWAVLGVLCVHSGQAAHSTGLVARITKTGQYGVQLFFVVSALTISLTYESHIGQFGRGLRSQFAWFLKRFFRIAPLYYFAALFYPVEHYTIYMATHHRFGAPTASGDVIANLLFLHTWVPSANNSVVPGGWSIGVEMFFYTLVPFVWMIKPIRTRMLLIGIAGVACLSITLVVNKVLTGGFYVQDRRFLYYWFPSQAPVIIIGLIFYFLIGPRFKLSQNARSSAAYFIGFVLCLPAAYYFGVGSEAAPILAPAILAVSFIFLILSLHGIVKRLVVNRFAVALGKISFSVYILQFAVLDCLDAALRAAHVDRMGPLAIIPVLITALAATSAVAYLSKRYIEDPGVAFGHKLSKSFASRAISPRQTPAPELS